MTDKPMIILEEQEWYQELIGECKSIMVEKGFVARMEIIEGKWLLGDRILQEEDNFERFGYGDKVVEKLANQLELSKPHLFKILQFRRKYPTWSAVEEQLPEGKAISWHKICQKMLPSGKRKVEETECSHKKVKCMKCGKILSYDKSKY